MDTTVSLPLLDSLQDVDGALRKLLLATLRHENLLAVRDREIAHIQKHYAPGLDKADRDIAVYSAQVEAWCRAHPEEMEPGKKSLQRASGLIGLRSPARPALVPISEKWTWERIEEKVRELWGKRYFHKPKPPAIDKEKLKKLEPAELKQAGLKLDDAEYFYCDLNRLAPVAAEEVQTEAA